MIFNRHIYFINRYGVNNQFDFDEEEFFDEAYNTTEDDSESNLENIAIPAEPQPNFVTLSRVQNKPILPSVIPMGGRHREAIEEETMEELNEPNFVTLSRSVSRILIGHEICLQTVQARRTRGQILAVWFKTDQQSVKQNLCLAPDQKMVRPKKVANYLKINLALKKNGKMYHL